MTITVVSDITTTPPKNTITVAVPGSGVMQSVSLWRNDAAGQTLVRTQPSAGFTSQFVADYECPYGIATSYGWTTVYTTGFTTLFDETWASTAAWTATGTAWTVAAGKASNGSGGGALQRAFTQGKYRFTVSSMANTSTSSTFGVSFVDATTTPQGRVSLFLSSAGIVTVGWSDYAGVPGSSTIGASGASPIVIDVGSATTSVTGVGGSVTVPFALQASTVSLGGTSTAGQFTVGEIKAQIYGTPTTLTETSTPVTLTPADLWLIHPITPSLSFKVKQTDATSATLTSIDQITNASNATVHQILGATKPVITTTGVRGSDTSSIGIRTYTSVMESALAAALLDQTPLLINFPPAWNSGFAYGFYQVGDVSRGKSEQTGRHPFRDFTLPITAVQAPVASVQNTGWSYAALLLGFATYASVQARFTTYANLLADV